MKKAVVLLSGGLDSATVLAMARRDGFTPYALSFDYGQRHQFELDCARRQAELQGATEHRILEIGLGGFGGSALTDSAFEVPRPENVEAIGKPGEIPVTYVPARNTIFLSFALGWAEVLQADDIFIGANALDYSGYPDCRPEYLEAFERMANLATARWVAGTAKLTIHAPLLQKTKAETVEIGLELGVDYGATHSCYAPVGTGRPCGTCDACLLRARGFEKAGASDPLTES